MAPEVLFKKIQRFLTLWDSLGFFVGFFFSTTRISQDLTNKSNFLFIFKDVLLCLLDVFCYLMSHNPLCCSGVWGYFSL